MKLTLTSEWDCTPDAFWALYFDLDFVIRLHLEGLGSTSAEVISQEGDLTSGLTRELRYGQRPNAPGPVRKIFGDEIISTEVTVFDPGTSTATFTLTPGTMADKTRLAGSIVLTSAGGVTTETFSLEAQVKIFGVGPVVERFIDHQTREIQERSVAFMRTALSSGA
jgi:hypothetical protein